MTQEEKRKYLIGRLLKEQPEYEDMEVPENVREQKQILRSLFNIRMPGELSEEFIKIQDEYLQSETVNKGIVELSELPQADEDIYLWKGDITTLKTGAIVNAANSRMLGCFYPCHGCIDNAIHTFAGAQLRNECNRIMEKKRIRYGRNYEEPAGKALITKGYNLPCDYVIHTVGPIIYDRVRQEDRELLASCYRSCLETAEENEIKSIAFCCISTGEFHFPNEEAARIAVKTVKKFKEETKSQIKVVFNVFKETDFEIYRELLGKN